MITPSFCRPGARCDRWRTCPHCGAARQARIADTAQRLLDLGDDVRLYTARAIAPGEDALRAAKRALLRGSTAPAGIWTIEQSPDGPTLHLHLLAPAGSLPTIRGAHIWQSDPVRSIRAAASYISKPECAPLPEVYDGRLWGTFGPLAAWLLHNSAAPIVQAAAIEVLLTRADSSAAGAHIQPPPPPQATTAAPTDQSGHETTPCEYREIARRHMPRLHLLAGDAARKNEPIS